MAMHKHPEKIIFEYSRPTRGAYGQWPTEQDTPNAVASDSNVGAVPLLSANMEYVIAPRWIALVDFDGLISPQGRALDVAAKIRYDLNDTWYVTAGYRVFEGGVDNDERFAFGWYNVAVVSLGVRY